jgi:5-oxoprolinase (ATP-hydrolysing)
MTISVWADIGGTFTDCLVSEPQHGLHRSAKVLSSGVVRAGVLACTGGGTCQLASLPAAATAQFWVGASASWLDAGGQRRPAGRIRDQSGTSLTLDRSVAADLVGEPAVMEIDAGIEAPVLATRILLGWPLSEPLPALEVRLGTTKGTNALLTRSGARTALLVTKGFADLLRIGEQDRPELFALAIDKPPPLTDTVIEVSERLSADGSVLQAIDLGRLREDLLEIKRQGVDSLAICLLHAHVNDAHERAARAVAERIGFTNISQSSEVAPLIKLASRAETTTLDAYLNPILTGYVARVWQQFGGPATCRLRWMTSSGNLVAPSSFRGRDCILSGPAGGVVALGHVATGAGATAAIGLDMGGTSTDVSRYEGQVGRRYESRVAGTRVMTPMMDIETVAAGGGSICLDSLDGRLTVGPASAGADPGPACYGRGGPLTVTDVNLLLGRIPASRFPFPLRREAAEERLAEIHARLAARGLPVSPQDLAEGFLNIAVTHMAEAVRAVSTARGSDVRQMALVGFGGAAGQHLCRVAAELGMRRILDHPDASMLSALGMGLADVGRVVTRGVYQGLDHVSFESLDEFTRQLARETDALLRDEHDGTRQPRRQYECDLRYRGTESSLALPLEPRGTLADRFHQCHLATYGYWQPGRQVELVAIRCEATLPSGLVSRHAPFAPSAASASRSESTRLWHAGQWIEARMFDRSGLRPGQPIAAPALIVGAHSTLVVEPGWQTNVLQGGLIELTALAAPGPAAALDAGAVGDDPVLLEVIARRLQGIADSMGEVLRRTSISVNVKERRDYSCAVFRGDGSLVASAPHVPVHLGAIGHTVRHLSKSFPAMSPGDCYLSNDPFAGGSHLPDVTAVSPVFCSGNAQADFFVASRAHHAEIGGRTPGSMPPDATSLAEEGVLIRDFALLRSGVSHVEKLRQLLSSGPYPSRCVEENLADVAAQQAAGAHGARLLIELANAYSVPTIDALMGRLLQVAGDSMRRWIRTLPSAAMSFTDALDDGTMLGVEIQRQGERLAVRFQSGPVHRHGFNATPAIVTAAVLYVLRCVSGSDLPLCDGVLRDVDLFIPSGLLDPPSDVDPARCAAVVAGNVETSQRIVDVLLGALGVAAASQGTMNNVLFGDETFGYYETIGGGSGATAGHDGADAVHTHMTNTRITDSEVLESRLPVRLCRFAIRRGSGGAGMYRGGDGIQREFEFLKPLVVSLITGRRTRPPYGAAGGQSGSMGRNVWIRSGVSTALPPTATFRVGAGDRLVIETPGGGGWGPSQS